MLFSKLRLSTLLIISICLQLGITVGLVGYFAIRSGENAVENVSKELSTEITRRIQERLTLHLELPHLVNQFNANVLTSNSVSVSDLRNFQNLLLQQVQSHEAINNSYIGTTDGSFWGVERDIDTGQLMYLQAGLNTGGAMWILEPESNTLPEDPIIKLSDFDPRKRPWYLAAIQSEGPVWSDVYQDFSTGELTITASQPVYEEDGELFGVLGSDFLFSANLNAFLRSLDIGESGKAFIIDRDGNLIASSTESSAIETVHNFDDSVLEIEPEDEFLTYALQQLSLSPNRNLSEISTIQQSNIEFSGLDYFFQISPLIDERGIDWLILVAIPEDDFLGDLKQNVKYTILFSLLALLISTLISIIVARKINNPLLRIIKATENMVKGDLNQRVEGGSLFETRALSMSFNRMAQQLQNTFLALSENEERFRSLIDNIPGAIYRCLNDENWTIEFISDSVEDISGYPATDFINNKLLTFANIIDLEDSQRVQRIIQSSIQNHRPYHIEYRIKHRDGSTRWVTERGQGTFDTNGQLLYLDGAIFDITRQKKHRNALRERDRTIRAIMNAIPDLLIRTTVDGKELDILGNTDFSFESTSINEFEKHIEDFMPPEIAQRRLDVVRQAIETHEIKTYEQYTQLADDQPPRHEEVRVAPINASEALVIVRDITTNKKIESALQELTAANRIQANMLPDYKQLCESIPQIDLVATMTPAKNVGGDFFDVFALDHRYLCVSIGDVSGKGIPAALFMVRAMTFLRMAVDTGMPLNTSASKVNQFLCMNNLDCMFVTLFVGLMDVYTGEMRYVSCGHNPPFLCRDGKTFEIVEPPQGILMGVFEGAEYEVGTLTLHKNDVLMLYTDGVTEAESLDHDYFSTERTIDVLNSVRDRYSPQHLVDSLQEAIKDFAKGMPQSDDITILALHYLGNDDMEPEKYEEIELDWLVQNLGIDTPHKL